MGVVMASDDVGTDSQVVRARGSVLGEPEDGSRTRPDGRTVRWRVAHSPKADPDLGVLFMIEHDRMAAEWTPAEVAERASFVHPIAGPARLLRVEVPVDDMKTATMRVHRDMGTGFRPSLAGGGARDATVGRQTLRLLRSGQGVVPGVVVSVEGIDEAREVSLLGCQWQLLLGY
jgi:hypothetical protein